MATTERAIDRGTRHAAKARIEIGREIRDARMAAGLSQGVVAKAARTSQAELSRIEWGRDLRVSIARLAAVLAILGQHLSLKAYPEASPLRDAAHMALLAALRVQTSAALKWRYESPVRQDPRDLRAWDADIRGAELLCHVEAEVRLHDLQALERRLELKQRDGKPGRLVLLVKGSRANRRLLVEHAASLRDAFPLGTAEVLAALRDGRDPGANGIVAL